MRRRLAFRGLLLGLGSMVASWLAADDRIVIDAELNDQPLKLAFDTGAGPLIIFRRVTEQRSIKVEPPPADTELKPGEVLLSKTEPVKLAIMGLTLTDVKVSVVDFELPSAASLDIDGVVGWASIRNNIWFLNGSTLKFSYLQKLPPETAGWTKLRELRKDDSSKLVLELPQTNSGQPGYLGIDTGADSGVRLAPEAWTKWRAAHRKQPSTIEAYSFPGIPLVVSEYSWADEIDLKGVILRGVPVTSMHPTEVLNWPPGTVAVLGLTATKRLDTVLDGKNGFAYLHPLVTPPRPYNHNRLGAVFVPADLKAGVDLIAHVAQDGPAAKAGVRQGDVLLKIDQLDVTPWRTKPGILPLRRFWEQAPGTKLRLTLRREGKIITTDVELRNLLGPEPKSP